MDKYSKQFNALLNEITEMRDKNINLENDFFKKDQEMRRI